MSESHRSEAPDHSFTVNPLYVDRSNPSQLAERLYLAGIATARDFALLRSLGITAVVNLTPDDPGCSEVGFKTLQIPIDDAVSMFDPVKTIATFIARMEEWEAGGETILIHCHAGISRTSCFAIAWLMWKRGCNAESDLKAEWSRAEDLVGKARPIIMPHYLLKRGVMDYFAAVAPAPRRSEATPVIAQEGEHV